MPTIIKHFFFGLLIFATISIHAQKSTIIDHNLQCINCDKPQDPSTVLEVQSTNRGVSLPSMNSNKRMNIANPINGLIVYDIDTNSFWYYESTQWTELISSSSPAITAHNFGVSKVYDEQKLSASDGDTFDSFGRSVAIDGNTAIIAAHQDDDNGTDSGSAYIFSFDGNEWIQTAKLIATDGTQEDYFGYNVDIDGNTVIISAYKDDIFGTDSGSAYIFSFDGNNWTQTAKLLPNDGAAGDVFGHDVSIDGNIALIGARLDDDNGNNSGSAYIFTFDGNNWIQTAKLLPNDGATGDSFGGNVAIDGNTAIIGASSNDDNGNNSGSAYIFTFDGNSWTQTINLLANDGTASDVFGGHVDIHGNTAIISASGDNQNGNISGSAYIFSTNGNSWSQTAKLIPNDGDSSDFFGSSVAISGNTAVIGAFGDDESAFNSGSAYIFSAIGNNWSQTAKLIANDGSGSDALGTSVDIDGNTAIIGANLNENKGSVYIY